MSLGIESYGVYFPRYRISVEEIAKIWNEDAEEIKSQLQVLNKSVPANDEDVATMAVESARNALSFWLGEPKTIGAIYTGSESHPYAVKPTSTIVGAAIDAENKFTAADLEFACKAGTAGMQMCIGLVKADIIKKGMAIGVDNSQAKPNDPLEYTAGAGSAAYIIGKENIIASIDGTYSVTTDTPDFWRREGSNYPSHGQRFTGGPAYFKHVIDATQGLMDELGTSPSDYTYATFHQPNSKFPLSVGKMLGFSKEQIELSLICKYIGNTYSASSMIGLASILDKAKPDDRILMTSYGSGAGSDAFSFTITEEILKRRTKYNVKYYVERKKEVTYGEYAKLKGILQV